MKRQQINSNSYTNIDRDSFIGPNQIYNSNTLDDTNSDIVRPLVKKKKILVLGSPGVGKSAVIMRFKDDIFLNDYIPTLQETYRKEFTFHNEKVELEINDLDGQNELTLFSSNKYGNNAGYILVYSVEDRYSFKMIQTINSKLNTLVGDKVPKILVGNKVDLDNRRISTEEGQLLANSINAFFLESSARNGTNIQFIFNSILVEINKRESNIDLKNFSCSGLIRYVQLNINLSMKINYFLLGIQIVFFLFKDIRYSDNCLCNLLRITGFS